ncbi:MAG: hypothetical protein ACXWLZ_12530 [Rhizomicrobium sp.]
MELKEEISASHHINPDSLEGDMTMLTKIALAAALIAGTVSVALAEGDSTIGIYGSYAQAAQQRSAPAFTSRNVGLGGQYVVPGVQAGYDRASSPYAGGGF